MKIAHAIFNNSGCLTHKSKSELGPVHLTRQSSSIQFQSIKKPKPEVVYLAPGFDFLTTA